MLAVVVVDIIIYGFAYKYNMIYWFAKLCNHHQNDPRLVSYFVGCVCVRCWRTTCYYKAKQEVCLSIRDQRAATVAASVCIAAIVLFFRTIALLSLKYQRDFGCSSSSSNSFLVMVVVFNIVAFFSFTKRDPH